MIPRHRLAMESIHIEQDLIKEIVGSQDQVNVAYGGFNRIQFNQSGKIIVDPIILQKERLETLNTNLMLFYTGIVRTREKVVRDILAKEKQLVRMHPMVNESIEILMDG